MFLGLSIVLLVGGVSAAITNNNANAYKVIIERNPFGLRPPPPPEVITPPPPPKPTTDVTLTGITSMLGKTKAYLVTKEQGKNESEYHSLATGDKAGSVEVLEIDEKAGTVKILNSGQPTVLNFKDHGAKATAAAASVPGVSPGMVALPGGRPGVPLSLPGGSRPPTPLLIPGASAVGAPSPATSPVFQNVPSRTPRLPLSSGESQNTTVPHPPQAKVTAEESIVLMEINRAQYGGDSKFPPLPPTPLTPDPPTVQMEINRAERAAGGKPPPLPPTPGR